MINAIAGPRLGCNANDSISGGTKNFAEINAIIIFNSNSDLARLRSTNQLI